jgi:hypothetical protein
VCIALRVMDSVITKVPCCTIVNLLLIRNETINFLNISLEVTEVLESLILLHDRLRILVEPVLAGSEGSNSCQQEQRSAQKGFDIIIIFHNVRD